jgi:hypothetical protein
MVMVLLLGHLFSSADRPAVDVHEAPIGCGVWKDHVPTALIAGWVWCGRPSLLIGWRPVVVASAVWYGVALEVFVSWQRNARDGGQAMAIYGW